MSKSIITLTLGMAALWGISLCEPNKSPATTPQTMNTQTTRPTQQTRYTPVKPKPNNPRLCPEQAPPPPVFYEDQVPLSQ